MFSFSIAYILFYLCALVRITIFIYFLPLFPKRNGTHYARLLLGIFLALLLTISQGDSISSLKVSPQLDIWVSLIAQEIAIGMVMGFVVFLLEGILLCIGSFISQLTGFEIIQALAPGSVANSSLISLIVFYLGVLALLAIDAHHYFLKAIAVSLTVIPPGSFQLSPDLFQLVFNEWRAFFRFTLLIAAPFLLLAFATSLELGILGRMVPQMNIFLIEYPMRMGAGIILLAWFLPFIFQGVYELFGIVNEVFTVLLG